jgi:hypothetical protein
MRPALALPAVAAVFLLAGCGSSTSGSPAMDGGATTAVESVADEAGTALLERVDVGRHEGFDRIVFRFENLRPGYKIAYVDRPIVEDGSGAPIEVAGGAVLLVRMEPASGFDLETGEGRLVYKGPRRIDGTASGASVVKELVRTGDFEAVLSWAIGLEKQSEFRVQTLDDPARLVVDVASA